jgi:hypothetical protein
MVGPYKCALALSVLMAAAGVASAASPGPGYADISPSLGAPPDLTEKDMAQHNHSRLASVIVSRCLLNGKSSATWAQLVEMLTAMEPSVQSASDLHRPILTAYQLAALSYSAELRDQRIKLDGKIKGDDTELRWFQYLVVLIGGLATVVIGVKPLFEGKDWLKVAFAAFAIILSRHAIQPNLTVS